MAQFTVTLSGMENSAGEVVLASEEMKNRLSDLKMLEAKAKRYSSQAGRILSCADNELSENLKKIDYMAEVLQRITRMYRNAEEKIAMSPSEKAGTAGNKFSAVIDLSSSAASDAIKALKENEYVFSALQPGMSGAMIIAEEIEGKKGFLGYDVDGISAEGHKIKFGISDKDRKNTGEFGKNIDKTYIYENGEFVEEKSEDAKEDKGISYKDIAENITLAELEYSLLKGGTVLGEAEDGSKIVLNKRDIYIRHKLTAGSFESKIGGEYSLMSFDGAERQLVGNDMFGAHASGNVKLLSASAAGSFSVGWLNEKGEFNPHLDAGINAEVTVVKCDATVGMDILGADVDIKASAGVGLGFHAKAGIDNGVLKLDLGGYIGIGGDISLEIDLSGAAETVSKVVDFATDAVSAIGDGFQAVSKIADGVGDVISGGIKTFGNAISEGWSKLKFW